MRALAACRPPAPAHRGGARHPDDDLAVYLEGEQRPPYRHPAHEVLGAVHRVDHPSAPGVGTDEPLLLAEYRVAGPGLGQPRTDHRLHGGVGVGDRGGIGFRLDAQVNGLETGECDCVGGVREGEGEGEVVTDRVSGGRVPVDGGPSAAGSWLSA